MLCHEASRQFKQLSTRHFHSSVRGGQVFKQLPSNTKVGTQPIKYAYKDDGQPVVDVSEEIIRHRFVKRNAAGVQMLPRSIHQQIFKNCKFPEPSKQFINISLDHLKTHDLDPSQSSTLPVTDFTMPPLQGSNLLEHFHCIGVASSEPYISMAKSFIDAELPPRPENWDIQAGWTKYYHQPDGSSYSEHVPYPIHDNKSETLLSFDVETMPKHHQYAIMACAASPNAWYSWISPWILDPSSASPEHFIPLGPSEVSRIVVGHNVSYDRSRILEEYHLDGSKNRFLDTMALHIAVKGISSHQRPAWMKHRKKQEEDQEKKTETIEAVTQLIKDVRTRLGQEQVEEKLSQLRQLLEGLEESLPYLYASLNTSSNDGQVELPDSDDEEALASVQKRWEDITSANSLLDVAKLHCSIDISKEIRDDFMVCTPEEILANITDYLSYCASDVYVTHRVYQKVLPAFLKSCPHPVSFAGMLSMGSAFLPVNEKWEEYLQNAERVYLSLERRVKDNLADLARAAVARFAGKQAHEIDDVWLAQLDWTPKVAGKSRGIEPVDENVEQPQKIETMIETDVIDTSQLFPEWYRRILSDPFSSYSLTRILPLLLQLSYSGSPLRYSDQDGWHYMSSSGKVDYLEIATGKKIRTILSKKHTLKYLQEGKDQMQTVDIPLARALSSGERGQEVKDAILKLAKNIYETSITDDCQSFKMNPWLGQLDWSMSESDSAHRSTRKVKKTAVKKSKPLPILWPKWFWELTKPKKDMPPGTLDITTRNRITPLLLQMSWHGNSLFHSREHGWTFRVSSHTNGTDQFQRLKPLSFHDAADEALADAVLREGYTFYKLPHKDGDKANVGSPLTKPFMKYAVDGILKCGAGEQADEIVDVGVQCSYWVSARDRILNQMVGWQDRNPHWNMGFPPAEASVKPDIETDEQKENRKWGIILPQVLTMGTVTRRAIEKTWLTASNAKKNRVGSELKAMVRAPPGYAIVGADVDSEELWISSCMGDAQFGFHGATAIGWMTLEGTKSAGTDLHSKTAKILGISRDQAKVFNYSRIYGAGMRHAVLLLLQGNPSMLPDEAQKLASDLYASTKGKNTHRADIFERKFWYGGTESYLFNKLEEIALSENPQTPALGCRITDALSKGHLPAEFGSDYMTSRINWAVQSSGVDYLHLLIVAVDYMVKRYGIRARYLISVHDELRYLVKEEDRYRLALALQVANAWTRSMFAYKLGMDDLPQGIAFFSAVDIDTVLRKEVDMPCVTPSQPHPIPPGETVDIAKVLDKTNGGSLWADGRPMTTVDSDELVGIMDGFIQPDCLAHRAKHAAYLRAQATDDFGEIKHLAKEVYGSKFSGGPGPQKRRIKKVPLGNGDGFDWGGTIEEHFRSAKLLGID